MKFYQKSKKGMLGFVFGLAMAFTIFGGASLEVEAATITGFVQINASNPYSQDGVSWDPSNSKLVLDGVSGDSNGLIYLMGANAHDVVVEIINNNTFEKADAGGGIFIDAKSVTFSGSGVLNAEKLVTYVNTTFTGGVYNIGTGGFKSEAKLSISSNVKIKSEGPISAISYDLTGCNITNGEYNSTLEQYEQIDSSAPILINYPTASGSASANGGSCEHHDYVEGVIEKGTVEKDGKIAMICRRCGNVDKDTVAKVPAYLIFNKECEKAIREAKGTELIIETNIWESVQRSVLKALAEKPELSLTINYKYEQKYYTVTIPAGTDMEELMGEDDYFGFRFLNGKFGGSERLLPWQIKLMEEKAAEEAKAAEAQAVEVPVAEVAVTEAQVAEVQVSENQ